MRLKSQKQIACNTWRKNVHQIDTYLFTLTKEFTCGKILNYSLAIVHVMLSGSRRTYLLSCKHSSPTTLCPRNVEIEPKCPNTVLRKNQMGFLIYTWLVMFFLLCRKTITKLQNINVLTKIWPDSFQRTSMNFVQKAEVVGYILTLVRFFHNILQDTVTDKLRKTSLGERRQMWGL